MMNLIVTCARHLEEETEEELRDILDELGDSEIEVSISDLMKDFEVQYREDFPITIEVEYDGDTIEYLAHFSTHRLDPKMVEDYALTDSNFAESVDDASWERINEMKNVEI